MDWQLTGEQVTVNAGFWYKVDKNGYIYCKPETRGRKVKKAEVQDATI